jgi:hypothetical protein
MSDGWKLFWIMVLPQFFTVVFVVTWNLAISNHVHWERLGFPQPDPSWCGEKRKRVGEMSEMVPIPFVPLTDWHPWFAWYPVMLYEGHYAWLRWVEKRKVWFIFFDSEFREPRPTVPPADEAVPPATV